MADESTKTCFVIAPIGEPETKTRERSDTVLDHIIRPALEPLPLQYNVVRADEINKSGIIRELY